MVRDSKTLLSLTEDKWEREEDGENGGDYDGKMWLRRIGKKRQKKGSKDRMQTNMAEYVLNRWRGGE